MTAAIELVRQSFAKQYHDVALMDLAVDGRTITLRKFPAEPGNEVPHLSQLEHDIFQLVIKNQRRFDLLNGARALHRNIFSYLALLHLASGESDNELTNLSPEAHSVMMPALFVINAPYFFEAAARGAVSSIELIDPSRRLH